MDHVNFNNDEFYSMAMKDALDMRTMATLKFSYWLDHVSIQAKLIKDQPLKVSPSHMRAPTVRVNT